MAAERVSTRDGFISGSPYSKWYKNLKRTGSCLTLLALLQEHRSWIHVLGPKGITVLHKGVQHGCVALVRFVLVDVFDAQGHCHCSPEHDGECASVTREELLRKESSYGSTAVNMAVVSGSPKMVVLLDWAIEVSRRMSGKSTPRNLYWKGDDDSELSRDFGKMQSTFLKDKGRAGEVQAEITDFPVYDNFPAPNVKDDDMNILESSEGEHAELIRIIEYVLDHDDYDQELMDMLKELCRKDVDFEFVPLAHVFLHFLVSVETKGFQFSKFRKHVLKRVITACSNARNIGEASTLLLALFHLIDPRGRTLLHAAFEVMDMPNFSECMKIIAKQLVDVAPDIKRKCLNARDSAGRTILHLACICDFYGRRNEEVFAFFESLDLRMYLSYERSAKLKALTDWCFPCHVDIFTSRLTSVHLAVLFNSTSCLRLFWPKGRNNHSVGIRDPRRPNDTCEPLQLAGALGRAKFLEHILEHHSKFNSAQDHGLGNEWIPFHWPALHCAAFHAQVEAIQSILKFPVYDPIVQSSIHGTALHLLLNNQRFIWPIGRFHDVALMHVLPDSEEYERVKDDFVKLQYNEDTAVSTRRMFSANEISCINLLLQAGIDIWTPHVITKELPSPGPMANDEARKWWYDKVVHEVVTLKTNVSNAANATSVVAALVATASFVGPFQPPLGYGDASGYVHTDQSPVRVYLVSNSLSFFFSIASILMAVLPAIPMPKESLYDELLRSQRCLKGGAIMLLISIICLLISFSSASLAVVSSEWQERQFVVAFVICGGVICVVVLVIYIIRLLRMLFHRNHWFRRKFAKYMYF